MEIRIFKNMKQIYVSRFTEQFKHQFLYLQRLTLLFWSLIKITMKSQQEEEAKAPDDSKINEQKPRISLTCLYAN